METIAQGYNALGSANQEADNQHSTNEQPEIKYLTHENTIGMVRVIIHVNVSSAIKQSTKLHCSKINLSE